MWVRGLKQANTPSTSTYHVAPYVGAWIETPQNQLVDAQIASHPMWVRGLKLTKMGLEVPCGSRTLCGCVDWNGYTQRNNAAAVRRTLCGCVDWNNVKEGVNENVKKSHPMWVRGLKLSSWYVLRLCLRRTLCGCVDWNFPYVLSASYWKVTPYVGVCIKLYRCSVKTWLICDLIHFI